MPDSADLTPRADSTVHADEEGITPLPGQEATPAKKSFLSRLGPAEIGSLAFLIAFLGIGWWALVHFLYSEHKGGDAVAEKLEKKNAGFQFPLQGTSATIESIQHGWRAKAPGDRAKPQYTTLPYIRLKIAAGSPGGFIRVWVNDDKGQPLGDIATLKVEAGAFKDTGRGEKLISPTEAEIAATVGFESETQFATYTSDPARRWSLKIEQGADYSKGPWAVSGESALSHEKLK